MNINTNKSKVICIGRNYVEHIHELNNDVPDNPVIFIKPNTAISSKLTLIPNRELHYECEIVLCYDDNYNVKAVGMGLDITDRNLQSELKKKCLPWELSKSFDGSAVISDFIEIDNVDVKYLAFTAYKNDIIIQKGGYDLMIYKPSHIIKFICSNNITICNNDLLMTGTPKGVGIINKNDVFKLELFCKGNKILEVIF